jgi:hypothetical protein
LTYGDLVAVGLEREHNFSDMARTLLMGKVTFSSHAISKSYVWQKEHTSQLLRYVP